MNLPSSISTEHLLIRPFLKKDVPLFQEFMTDKRATRYLLFSEEHKTKQGSSALLHDIIEAYSSPDPVFAYAIEHEDFGFVGSCGLSELPEEGVVECYYSLLPKYWKRGIATEALQGLVEYGFNQKEIREIRAYMDAENPDSRGVAIRAGMKDMGMHEHPIVKKTGKMYSITRKMFSHVTE